ncbi:putative GNAT-family acetyltransferase [Hypoxylon argillaceum]|nr:putative GNAT-family acetyltransferase [Hypoxylon argillaceum]KAI1147221.1 putative GNAT-family acetyltransferase [Nemania diffusa]
MASQPPTKSFGDIVELSPALHPSQETRLSGRFVTLVGLAPEHIEPFYANLAGDEHAHLWDYMADGPFPDPSGFHAMMGGAIASPDVIVFAVIPTAQPTTPAGEANVVGCVSYMKADLGNRTLEAGVLCTPRLQRTSAATEAMYLMARHAFADLGFRRYEWKCDALNAASRRAALRFGFVLEGVFRKHLIVKGRNRDTAWFAIVDDDWPAVGRALEEWLDPSNFDESGLQRRKLEDFRRK